MSRKNLQVRILDDRIGSQIPFPEYATEGSAGSESCRGSEASLVHLLT